MDVYTCKSSLNILLKITLDSVWSNASVCSASLIAAVNFVTSRDSIATLCVWYLKVRRVRW